MSSSSSPKYTHSSPALEFEFTRSEAGITSRHYTFQIFKNFIKVYSRRKELNEKLKILMTNLN